MKPIFAKLLLVLLLLFPAVWAQGDLLDELTIQDGWVSGTAMGCFGSGRSEKPIKVDCPLPEASYPDEILTLRSRHVSKRQMQSALRAAGQQTKGQFINPRGSAAYTGDWRAEAAADVSKEEAAAQAVRIGRAYFEALGVEVDPLPRSISRPYDFDAYMETQTAFYVHRFADPSSFIDRACTQWKRRMEHEQKQPDYTVVYFDLMVDGMRLWHTPSYPAHDADEPDAWEGFPAGAHVIVSDSGVLVEAACDLLGVQSRRPVEGDSVYTDYLKALRDHGNWVFPAKDWQDALRIALNNLLPFSMLSWGADEAPFQSPSMTEPTIAYAYATVITGIKPCLSTISGSEWAPFWAIETTDEYADGWRTP